MSVGDNMEAGRNFGWPGISGGREYADVASEQPSPGLTRAEPRLCKGDPRATLTDQLRGAKEVDEMLVIVQAPHAFTPRRFEPKHLLHLTAQLNVLGKDPHDEGRFVRFGKDAESAERDEVAEERELVPCAVVESLRGPEGRQEVEGQLW